MTRSTMQNRTIAVDVDDVIAAHIPEFIEYSNQHYGTNLNAETYNDDWPTVWGIPLEETLLRARSFHEDRIENFELIKDALPVLKRLALNHTLVVVTARQSYNIDATHAWINKHFEGVFTETHFVPIWEPNNTVSKSDICKQIGADYLIDDQPRHCNLVAEAGMTALLFGAYPWADDHNLNESVVRVDDWQAVGAYFRA